MAEKKTDELLERLRVLSECEFLSDLHDSRRADRLLDALNAIPSDAFSPNEWREAARYLLGGDSVDEISCAEALRARVRRSLS